MEHAHLLSVGLHPALPLRRVVKGGEGAVGLAVPPPLQLLQLDGAAANGIEHELIPRLPATLRRRG